MELNAEEIASVTHARGVLIEKNSEETVSIKHSELTNHPKTTFSLETYYDPPNDHYRSNTSSLVHKISLKSNFKPFSVSCHTLLYAITIQYI